MKFRVLIEQDEDGRVRLAFETGKIVMMKPIPPKEFIDKMEGCIKGDSPLPKVDPLHLKKIWGSF